MAEAERSQGDTGRMLQGAPDHRVPVRDLCRVGVLALLLSLPSTGAFPSSAPTSPPDTTPGADTPAATGRVDLTVEGFESARGQALVSLYLDKSGWPGDATKAFATQTVPIDHDLRAEVEFDNVPAGPFAVSVVHDKNDNRKLDKGLFGIPREPYGFSRDARSTFHAPSFDDARLEIAPDESRSITVHVH
jgi:uncharacterized protein (DUF2141 family)